jgi:cell envelope opacity-associated protein A
MARWGRTAVAVGAGVALLAGSGLALADDGQGQGGLALAGYASTVGYSPGFADMGSVPWATSAVDSLAQQCVIAGVGQGQFDPTGDTTRAEMAVLIDRLMGLGAPAPAPAGPPGPAAGGLAGLLGPGGSLNLQSLLGGPAGPGGPGGPGLGGPPGPPLLPPGLARRDRGDGSKHFEKAMKKLLRALEHYRGLQRGLLRGLRLHFRDSSSIPSWAGPSVAMAYEAGILVGEQDGQFAPAGSVTWAQAAVIVERVFRFAPVPPAQVAQELQQLPNGMATPPWAQQAVADEVAAGVFTGNLAQNYNPMQPIDRADMAVLLQNAESARAGVQLSPSAQLVTGRIVAVGSGSVTLVTGCGTVNVPLEANATVYQGGQSASLSALAPGQVVLIGLNAGQGFFVDVLSSPAAPLPQPLATGLVVAVSPTSLTLQEANQTSTFPVAAGVAVSGQVSSLAAVEPGDVVAVELNAQGQVTAIAVTAVGQSSTVSGTVTAVAANSISLTEADGTSASFTLATNVSVSGDVTSLSALASGDSVTLTLDAQQQVTAISVTAVPQTSTVSGTVGAISSTQVSVTEADGTGVTFDLASSVGVSGLASSLSAVVPGDQVTLTLNTQGQVTEIDVTAVPQTSTVTGTVNAISSSDIMVTPPGGSETTYALAATVTVTGQVNAQSALVPGDQVTITLNAAKQVVAIDVTAVPSSTTVSGTVQAVGPTQISVQTSSGSLTFDLASGATVSGQVSSLSAVVPGDQVSLTLNAAGQVTAVDVTSVPQSQTITGTVQAIGSSQVTVQTSSGNLTFDLSPSVAVSGQVTSLGAVLVGDQVTLTLNADGVVVAIDVTQAAATSTMSGIVSAVSAPQLSLAVSGPQGTTTYAFTLASGVQVQVQGTSSSLAAVQAGEQVTVTIDSQGQVSAIDVTAPPAATTTMAGTLISVATQPASVTFATYDASTGSFHLVTLDLAPAATITRAGTASSLSALALGDALSVGVDAAGQAVQVAAAPLPSADTVATGVVDINSAGELGVYVTGSNAHQVTVADGPSPLALTQSGSTYTIVSLSSIAPGTQATVIQNAINADSLLLIAQ